ncbi:hypothetical protein CBL_08428 [Carabus blaptoides fortunei]
MVDFHADAVPMAIPQLPGDDDRSADQPGVMPKEQYIECDDVPEDLASPVPVASDSTVPDHVSPGNILTLPKVTIRRKRSGLKSMLLTSTPNKKLLLEKKED